MTPNDLHQDLEAFQRWGMVVDDELRDAVDAVVAFEDPDAEGFDEAGELLASDEDTSDVIEDLVKEITVFREDPDRPAWFTPELQMILVVSTWVEFLADYIEEAQTRPPSLARWRLLSEKVFPALDHYGRWMDALCAAGYFPDDKAGHTSPSQG